VTAFIIEHSCPQCGAPVELEETDRLIRCGFCRVASVIDTSDFFRYVIPHRAENGKPLIYFPYWRFKGMLFSCLAKKIEQRFVDVSHQAFNSPYFPPNIGFRGQTQKIRFLDPDPGDAYVKPNKPFTDVLSLWSDQFSATLPKPILHQEYIGETFSMIYAPFYLDSALHDAVLNQAVSQASAERVEAHLVKEDRPRWSMRFLATLCPGCGWDLQGDRDSLALNCTNCQSVWWVKKGRLQQLNTAHAVSTQSQVIYLPFWRIQADVGTITLNSYADLVRVANLPRVAQPEWDKLPFYFWNPAFKVRPQSYLTIATTVTLNQPALRLTAGQPKGQIQGINLPLREALESIKLNLANFLKPKERLTEWIPEIDIKPKRFLLIYLPFAVGHHELIHEDLNLAINKNLLGHAKNL
jgi:predicted RNA-binding Zn-ribbon protein involved in translation (DUF1610 family)